MKERLLDLLTRAEARIDQRARRERILLLATAMAVVGALWWQFAATYWLDRMAALEQQINDVRSQQASTREELADLRKALQHDPDAALRREIAEVREKTEALRAELEDTTADLIPPDRMKAVLRGLLRAEPGARLLRLRTLETRPVVAPADGEPGIYRHGVEIRFEADYTTTVEWLRAAEALPWAFGWERLDYTVTEYPRARITVRLFTLSGHEEWLGV
mgnify:CR=1 FL=1